jgi:hypothetical protein
MATVSFLARAATRRTFDKVVRSNQFASIGAARFASYFTPGTPSESYHLFSKGIALRSAIQLTSPFTYAQLMNM